MYLASQTNAKEVVKYLLEHGANPLLYPVSVWKGDSVLRALVTNRYPIEIIKRVLEAGGDPNREYVASRQSPMSEATDPNVLELLLKHGGNPDIVGSSGRPRVIELAEHLQMYDSLPKPLSPGLKGAWEDDSRLFELFCIHGSTYGGCQEYREKRNFLEEKTAELTKKILPENVVKNILRIGHVPRGGQRRIRTSKVVARVRASAKLSSRRSRGKRRTSTSRR